MTDTTTINNTLVHLESLYKAYDEILGQAKSQLESLEVDDTQMGRIVDKLTNDIDFLTAVTKQLKEHQGNLMSAMTGELEDALVDKMAARVWSKLESSLEDALNDRFNELMNSEAVSEKVYEYIIGREDFIAALDIRNAMAMIVKQVK